MENQSKTNSPAEAAKEALGKLNEARIAVEHAVKVRAMNKLSFVRTANVAKEIRELIKVMSLCRNDETIKTA